MDGFTWAAFICYFLAALGGVVTGFMYLFRSTFMPYHREALGQSWDQLDQRLQTLIIALMRSVGGTMLGVVISVIIILVIPFRAGEFWPRYTIPAVCLIAFMPALYAVYIVKIRTHASTPVAFNIAGIVLIIVGFILSFF